MVRLGQANMRVPAGPTVMIISFVFGLSKYAWGDS